MPKHIHFDQMFECTDLDTYGTLKRRYTFKVMFVSEVRFERGYIIIELSL